MREAWKRETYSVSVFFLRVGSQISPRRAKKDPNIPSPRRTRSVKSPTPGTTKTIKSPPLRLYIDRCIMRAHARPLFLRTVFQFLFRISQSNGKKENPKTNISALKSVFGFRVRLQIRILKSKSRFPIRTHPKIKLD